MESGGSYHDRVEDVDGGGRFHDRVDDEDGGRFHEKVDEGDGGRFHDRAHNYHDENNGGGSYHDEVIDGGGYHDWGGSNRSAMDQDFEGKKFINVDQILYLKFLGSHRFHNS